MPLQHIVFDFSRGISQSMTLHMFNMILVQRQLYILLGRRCTRRIDFRFEVKDPADKRRNTLTDFALVGLILRSIHCLSREERCVRSGSRETL